MEKLINGITWFNGKETARTAVYAPKINGIPY